MTKQGGNVLFYLLIAIFLLGALTVALRSSGTMEGGIDKESANVKAQQIIRFSDEVAQAVQIVLDNGASETDLRFAHPNALANYGTITTTPEFQIFSSLGGKAAYRLPPTGANDDGSKWIFAGNFSLPQVGSDRGDLVALLRVTKPVCDSINSQLSINTTPAISCGSPVAFIGSYLTPPDAIDPAAFTQLPVSKICYRCTNITDYYSYSAVLYAR